MITYQGTGPNYNSPIVNSMYSTGPGNIPTIGQTNMMPIGSMGYNPGYMNGYYNQSGGYGYYNPYLLKEQQKLQEAKAKEQARKNGDIWKKISRSANAATGVVPSDMIEQHVSKYDYQEPVYDESYYKMEVVHNTYRLNSNVVPVESLPHHRVIAINKEMERMRQEVPEDISMNGYLRACGKIYYDMLQEQSKRRSRDASKLYNVSEYNQLLNLHKGGGGGYFDNVFTPSAPNLDDMEISLPTAIKDSYEQRKAAFKAQIYGNNRMVI